MSYPRDMTQTNGIDYSKEESRTKQSFSQAADINFIMKQFEKTGTIEDRDGGGMTFGDFTGVEDFHTALNKVHAAERAFAELPAEIRARMQHDPGVFMEFVGDPDNLDEGIQLGLWDKPAGWIHPDKREAPQAPEETETPSPETEPPEGGVS